METALIGTVIFKKSEEKTGTTALSPTHVNVTDATIPNPNASSILLSSLSLPSHSHSESDHPPHHLKIVTFSHILWIWSFLYIRSFVVRCHFCFLGFHFVCAAFHTLLLLNLVIFHFRVSSFFDFMLVCVCVCVCVPLFGACFGNSSWLFWSHK